MFLEVVGDLSVCLVCLSWCFCLSNWISYIYLWFCFFGLVWLISWLNDIWLPNILLLSLDSLLLSILHLLLKSNQLLMLKFLFL